MFSSDSSNVRQGFRLSVTASGQVNNFYPYTSRSSDSFYTENYETIRYPTPEDGSLYNNLEFSTFIMTSPQPYNVYNRVTFEFVRLEENVCSFDAIFLFEVSRTDLTLVEK